MGPVVTGVVASVAGVHQLLVQVGVGGLQGQVDQAGGDSARKLG
ncbi:MAG: hypothetical protein ACOYEV_12175 [Candidatus Nanopelagicales bacterium]